MRIGIHSGIPRSAHKANAGGGAADLPSTWDPFELWDGNKGITTATGVSAWAGQISATGSIQSTPGNQPAYDASDSVFNSQGSATFDGSGDVLQVDTADLSLLNQRFFHDDTTDWEILMVMSVPTGAPTGRTIIGTGTQDGATGFAFSYRGSNTLRCNLQNGATRIARATTAASAVVPDAAQLLRLNYNTTSKLLSLTIDAVTATDTSTAVVDTGDAQGSLAFSATGAPLSNAQVGVAYVFISKTIADASRKSEQNTYFNTRYGTSA